MALPTGSGSELIKTTQITDLTNSAQTLITGVANHIYTVISIIACETAGGVEAMNMYLADSDGSSNPLITSLKYILDSANFQAGSEITVYGSDVTPTAAVYPNLPNGAIFEESDTGKHYMFDGTDTWNEM